MLEPRRLERILLHLGHLDDPLLPSVFALIRRCVSDVGGFIIRFRNMFGLGGFDLAMGDTFKSLSCPFCCFGDGSIVRPFHLPLLVGYVGPIGERNEIYEISGLWFLVKTRLDPPLKLD